MKTKTLFFQLTQAKKKFEARDFWNYINAVADKRRPRSTATLDAPVLSPGQQLRATDRIYEVGVNGAWRKIAERPKHERDRHIPASQSQIRLLPKPDRNKYTREEAQKIRLAA